MTPDTDKIEELTCPFCGSKDTNEFSANRIIDGEWHERLVTRCLDCLSEASTETFRSLSAELTELRQAKESLDWLEKHGWILLGCQNELDCPPYLKSRLEGK